MIEITYKQAELYPYLYNTKGHLSDKYGPFQNLYTTEMETFTTTKLNFDLEHPVDILVQDAYDGAVNLILNDGKNMPRLINSRFSVQDNDTFLIPNHSGIKDTNIYDDSTFDIDTALKTIPLSIPKVEFLGLLNNTGNMPCGSYSFYFKLADADGNETEIMAESGVVQCHIGEDGKPNTIRMGMQDENSLQAISFKLSNIDTGLNYIHVYYCRHSSSNAQSTSTTYHKINFDYSVNKNGECSILITGNEDIQTAKKEEFYVNYADIDSTKTQELYNNVLFFGNNETQEHDWDMLKRMSWRIIPRIEYEDIDELGDIGVSTYDTVQSKGMYYNSKNIYYNVGYWPDEFYRFGIVYIFNDNSLSPVFNIQGFDMNEVTDPEIDDFLQTARGEQQNEYLYAPENYIFKDDGFFNAKGVLRFPKDLSYYHNTKFETKITHKPLRIKFDMSYLHVKAKKESDKYLLYYGGKNDYVEQTGIIGGNINKKEWDATLQKFLQYHKIKGFFFVRQRRIPTILCQGLAISLLKKECGAVPVLQKVSYFLNKNNRLLSTDLQDINRGDLKRENFSTKALLIPDAALNEASYNQIFISNKFSLEPVRKISFMYEYTSSGGVNPIKQIPKKIDYPYSSFRVAVQSKLTNIPDSAPLLTDGENYFAAQVGSASDPILVKNTDGDWTRDLGPKTATESTNYIRGLWGSYVGSSVELEKDYLYNIRPLSHQTLSRQQFNQQEFAKRFIDQNDYHAICDRTSFFIEDGIVTEIICARGDCFSNLFTHRIQRNFIDPELPTNTEIIDPKCWGKNFAVRATAKVPPGNDESNDNNCKKADEGWDNGADGTKYYNQVAQTFVLNTGTGSNTVSQGNYLRDDTEESKKKFHYYKWENGTWNYLGYLDNKITDLNTLATATGFSSDETQRPIAWNRDCLPHDDECKGIYLKEPEIIKTGMGVIDIVAALADSLVNSYVERSVTKINRADMNAVPIGQWITFPVYSNYNYAMRDIDHYSVTEEATFNEKRSFYPLRECNPHSPLRDSGIINSAAAISIPDKGYQLLPDAPFYKQEYFTRITNSLFDDAGTFSNELKVILEECYKDFTKIYGSITKITALNDHLYVIFKHGIGIINVTQQMIKNPDQPKEWLTSQLQVLSDQFGSLWKDSIINTGKYIYGVDSVAKIIWRINGTIVENISDITKGKVGKWLVDNIDMSEFTIYPYVGHINIKTHYNNNKHDVIFTYYNDIPESYDWKDLEDKLNKQGYYFPSNAEYPAESLIVKWNPLIQDYTLNTDYFTYNAVTREVIDLRTNMSVCAMPPVKKWKQGTRWALNFNEDVEVFTTFQDWYPLESENIDNIYFSFDRDKAVEIMDSVYSSENNIKIQHPNTYQYEVDKTHSILKGIEFTENRGTEILSEKSLCYKINKHNVDNSCFYKSTLFFCDKSYDINKVKFKFNDPIQNNKLYAFCFYIRTLSKSSEPTKLYLHCKDHKEPNNIINWKTSFEVNHSWQFVTLFYTNNSTSPRYKEDGIVFEIYPETEGDVLDIEYCEPKIMDCDYENNLMYENIYDELKKLDASNFNLCRSDYQSYGKELTADIYENSKHVLKYYFPRPSEEDGNLPLIQDKNYLDLRDSQINMKIWKHGQAGVYDNAGKIKPTNWYGKQHEFNFEFVVKDNPANQKIFNNLQIISNKTAPDKFEFEVVGESYEIQKYKPLLQWCAEKIKFYESDPEHNAAVWINVGGKGDYIRNPETKNFEKRLAQGDYTKIITYSTEPDKTADNYNQQSKDYIKNPFLEDFEKVESGKGTHYEIWNYEYVGYNGEYSEEISYEQDDKGKYTHNGLKDDASWVPSDLLTDVNDRYKQVYIHEYKGPHGGPYINKAQEYLYKYLLSTPVYKLKETYTDFPDVSFIQPDVKKCIQQLPKIDTVLSDKKGLPANDKTYTKNHKWKEIEPKLKGHNDFTFNCGETVIVEDEQLNEYRLRTEQLGNDINKYDRVRGNQQYLEDIWRIEIRPINFKFVYLEKDKQGELVKDKNDEVKLIETETFEARLRDKFIKIKVRYSGEDLALINNILTLYERSYA